MIALTQKNIRRFLMKAKYNPALIDKRVKRILFFDRVLLIIGVAIILLLGVLLLFLLVFEIFGVGYEPHLGYFLTLGIAGLLLQICFQYQKVRHRILLKDIRGFDEK